jgi:hypothetical protein
MATDLTTSQHGVRGMDLGRADEALEAAEDATFHAANIVNSYFEPSPDRDRLLDELIEINNRMRAITESAHLRRDGDAFEHGGPKWLSPAGRIWKRVLDSRWSR